MDDRDICETLIALFNLAFKETYQTILVSGGEEPIYLPAGKALVSDDREQSSEVPRQHCDGIRLHRIVFYRDYPRSALHEVSHWCIAGPERRTQTDYGYWYQPDGRTVRQQTVFEQVESKPQAIEWILCQSVGLPFRVSSDNLNGERSKTELQFKQNILAQVYRYFDDGLPERADIYREALLSYFRPSVTLTKALFDIEELG
ncbi:MAG: hypothetical protein CSA50_05630 [Gammaproteobacteria bacterium]|nr:MAG: hypothetical protein CSA50_05630 [Gammaproteobacteria bacterium]